MYAVIVQVKINLDRENEMRTMIHEEVVPRAKQLPGFASGYWLQALEGDHGSAVLLFESEEAVRTAAESLWSEGPLADMPVWTMEALKAYEVLAEA